MAFLQAQHGPALGPVVVHASSQTSDVIRVAGRTHRGEQIFLGLHPWSGANDGFFHGMRLIIQAPRTRGQPPCSESDASPHHEARQPHVSVACTARALPEDNVAEVCMGQSLETRKSHNAAPEAMPLPNVGRAQCSTVIQPFRRALPTPCRNACKAMALSRRTVCLADLVPLLRLDLPLELRMPCLRRRFLRTRQPPSMPISHTYRLCIRAPQLYGRVSARLFLSKLSFAFTDGSFCPQTGHVVCVGLQSQQIVRVGCLGGFLAFPEAAGAGAYAGEAEAILHARAALLASDAPILHLGSDCSSALAASTGNQGCPEEVELLLDGATGLAYATAAQGRMVINHKVSAHEGCAFNEAADSISKSIARSGCTHGLHPGHGYLLEQAKDKTLQWFWVLGDSPAQRTQYPFLDATGSWSAAAATSRPATAPTTMGLQPTPDGAEACQLDIHIVQYNCLSLKGHLAVHLMQSGLRRQGAHLAGFQETRTKEEGIRLEGQYWVIASPCTARGVGGCQIWLHSSARFGSCGEGTFGWDRQSFAHLCRHHQLLAVLVRAGPIKLALFSGHAPTAKAPEEERDAWWGLLRATLKRVPPGFVPILCLDANARQLPCILRPIRPSLTTQTRGIFYSAAAILTSTPRHNSTQGGNQLCLGLVLRARPR